jgi:hypothetical protein
MFISYINNDRLLINGEKKININDEEILEYTGCYYRNTNNHASFNWEETQFIGKVSCHRSFHEDGITGIYIHPLFIYSKSKNQWLKIINYIQPTSKYFYYPHLLLLPDKFYNFHPLYFLHTCINTDLSRFENINDTFDLFIENEL